MKMSECSHLHLFCDIARLKLGFLLSEVLRNAHVCASLDNDVCVGF